MRKEMQTNGISVRKNRPQPVNIWIFICVLKQYQGANSIIDKAITIVRNYEHYAQQAGVSPHWIQKITEEIGYRIEKVKRKF